MNSQVDLGGAADIRVDRPLWTSEALSLQAQREERNKQHHLLVKSFSIDRETPHKPELNIENRS